MYKRVFNILFLVLAFAFSMFLFSNKVEAKYAFCETPIVGTSYYDCGDSVYVYYENISYSSLIYASSKDESILYAGVKDGVEIFYAKGYDYFNYSHDDRSTANNNLWTTLTHKGELIFDGKFKDSWLLDDSHSGYIYDVYKDVTTIRQYINNGALYRTIAVYFISGGTIEFGVARYDGISIDTGINEVLDCEKNFSIDLSSQFGIKQVIVKINNNEVPAQLVGSKVYIDKNTLNSQLVKGEVVDVEVLVKDYFGAEASQKYQLLLLNNNASINFETMTSTIESSSRRIVINATAGKGKKLDTDYCWYYWSTSPDDSLLYDDFLKNYANSSYKGSYSEDKGVILRNTSGVYYLYALAKDDDSSIVVRSEGYTLNNQGYRVHYTVNDAILIVSLLILSLVPISIYLHIRKKGD